MENLFQIRVVKPNDTEQILAIYSPYIEKTAVSFETKIPTLSEFHERIHTVIQEAPWLVCEKDNNIVGYAYASSHRSRQAYRFTRELSVYVVEPFKKRKIATALYVAVIELMKLQGYANALVGIAQPNPESINFHEKFGFKSVGTYHKVGFKFDQYHDVSWFELPIRDQVPKEITPLISLSREDLVGAIEKGNQLILQDG